MKKELIKEERTPNPTPPTAQAAQILAWFYVSNRPCRVPDSRALPTRLIHGASGDERRRQRHRDGNRDVIRDRGIGSGGPWGIYDL